MAVEAPYPELDEFLSAIGADRQRVGELAASEGAAGNISICMGWPIGWAEGCRVRQIRPP